jgi:hypothetical protein
VKLSSWWQLCSIAQQCKWDSALDAVYAPIAGRAVGTNIGVTSQLLNDLQVHPKYPFFRREDFTGSDAELLKGNEAAYLAITPNGPVFVTEFWMSIQ